MKEATEEPAIATSGGECECCETAIAAGESIILYNGIEDDGSPAVSMFHPDCRKEEIRLNNEFGNGHDDDWFSLLDHVHDSGYRPDELELPDIIVHRLNQRLARDS